MRKLKFSIKDLLINFWPYLILLILTLFYFRHVLILKPDQIIYGGDLLTQFYFWKGYLVDSIKNGFIPFWNPYNFSGTPFLAHPAIAAFYPGTLIFLLFPLNMAFSINYFIHIIIGGCGMYWLARKYSDKITGVIVSSLFILSGFFAARIYAGHVDLLTTAVWVPLVFSSYKDLLESLTYKKFLFAVFFLSLMILAGYQAYILSTAEFLLGYTLFILLKEKDFKFTYIFNRLFLFIRVVSTSALITSVQWLPTWQLTKLSIRGQGFPYELASWGTLPLTGLKLFFQPYNRDELNKITFNLGGGPVPNPFDHFVGRLPLIIIFIFLIVLLINVLIFGNKRKITINHDFWFFLAASIFFLWISLGNNISPNLHFLLYQIIPLYRFIRIPLQNLIYVVFLVPLLTGLVLSLFKNKIIKLILLIFFILELIQFNQKLVFTTRIPEQNYDKKLVNYLESETGQARLLPHYRVISPVLQSLDLNSSLKYHLYTTSGYDPVILQNYYRFIDLSNKTLDSSLVFFNVEIPPIKLNQNTIDLLSVGYILEENTNSLDSFYEKYSNQFIPVIKNDIFTLYKNKNTKPRFFATNSVQKYSSLKDIEFALIRRNLDIAEELFILDDINNLSKEDVNCVKDKIGDVIISNFSPNKITLSTQSSCDAYLSTSEVYYPGWKAKIDNKPTKIFPGNYAFRAIFLPKGVHIVEFYYSPIIYFIGLLISIISLTILFLLSKKVITGKH